MSNSNQKNECFFLGENLGFKTTGILASHIQQCSDCKEFYEKAYESYCTFHSSGQEKTYEVSTLSVTMGCWSMMGSDIREDEFLKIWNQAMSRQNEYVEMIREQVHNVLASEEGLSALIRLFKSQKNALFVLFKSFQDLDEARAKKFLQHIGQSFANTVIKNYKELERLLGTRAFYHLISADNDFVWDAIANGWKIALGDRLK